MKYLKFFLILLSFFSLSSYAEQVTQVKGKLFIFSFSKEKSQSYKSGTQVKFYDNKGKLSLIAKIKNCNSRKCKAVTLKRRRGFQILKGVSIFSTKQSTQVVKSQKILDTSKKFPYKYALRGGLGGQNSATLFTEFDYIFSPKWVFGFALSNRIISRKDFKITGIGYGLRADYYFNSYDKNGLFVTLSLGMANLSYQTLNLDPSITNFTTSQTAPYFNFMGGYRKWFGERFNMNFAGGLSYIGYKAKFTDPNNGSVFSSPYRQIDLALEVSLGYSF